MTTRNSAIVLYALTAIHGYAAAARVPVPDDTVAERSRPELTPAGLRAGAFKLYPSLKLGLSNDDNIYADADDRVSDTIRVVAPRLDVASDWSRHALELRLSGRFGRYANNAVENFDDVVADAKGRIAISRASELTLAARLESLHQDRFSPDDQDGLTPTEYDRATLSAGFRRAIGRVVLKLDAAVGKLDYDDVASVEGSINHDDRDRTQGEVGFRLGYEVSPSTKVFVNASFQSVDYDSLVDDNGFVRGWDGRRVAIGAEFELSGLTSVEAQLGLRRRNFDALSQEDVQSVWFDGKIIHRLSGLTTLSAFAKRDFKETTFAASSGYFATRVGAGVDHELLRNLVLQLHVYRQDEDYESSARRDAVFSAKFGAHYMLNRKFDIVFGAAIRDRDGDERFAQDDYRIRTVSLAFVGKR